MSYTTLGKYNLLRTLGTGAFSKVKLALNTQDGQYYAIKIHKEAKIDKTVVETVENEAKAFTQLQHKNIVNLIEYQNEGEVKKPNGSTYKVRAVVVQELAEGGELFFYVKNSGYFEEKYARYYFRQIIDGLEYCHQQGYAHRDIKPDNILLDRDFNVKIADFGFAGPIKGRDGKGKLKTQLGTKPYEAPEILKGIPYNGESVDLFATGIVLFICVSGTPPFTCAEENEFYYKLIVQQKWELFWKFHVKGKPGGANFFSEEFKHLIQSMFQFDPTKRLSIQEIKDHPWYKGPLPHYAELQQEFGRRKEINDEETRKAQAVSRTQNTAQYAGAGAHRGLGDEDDVQPEEEKKSEPFELQRPIDQYVKIPGRKTEIMIAENPDVVLEIIQNYIEEKQQEEDIQIEVTDNQYKAVITYNKTPASDDLQVDPIKVTLKIYRVDKDDIFVIDFTKKSGDPIEFLTFYKDIDLHIQKKFGYATEEEQQQEDQE